MKRLVAAGIAGVLLTGCAPVAFTKADVDGRIVCNAAEMDRIEQSARRNFTQVMWVNCPSATLRVI